MAWVDVRKAYDSVDHGWLREMFTVHRFPVWLCKVITKLSASWNTRISVRTAQGVETSEVITFRRGLPQGDALCPRLFTLCINPVSWMLKATEGCRLSKPIGKAVTHLLYIDDFKIFAASRDKLRRAMAAVRGAMKDIGLEWNERKCSVAHVKRGTLEPEESESAGDSEREVKSLSEGSHYKFLGVMENTKQDDDLSLQIAGKAYLQRLSLIWSSPLSDVMSVTTAQSFSSIQKMPSEIFHFL